jgi:hypothetical protein
MGIIFLAGGCGTPKRAPNPLEGWKLMHRDPNKLAPAIWDDYQDYVQKLPVAERHVATEFNPDFLEDGTGRHALRLSIPLSGTWWEHVLLYDQNNRRVQATKRITGHYQS